MITVAYPPGGASPPHRHHAQVFVYVLEGSVKMQLDGPPSLWATKEDLEDYRSHYKINIPLTLDDTGMLFREFGVNNTPTLIVADSKGTIVRRLEPKELGSLRQAMLGL